MPSNSRVREAFAPDLSLPPPFTLVTLREVNDAFSHAVEIAPERGAGTLTYVGRFDLAEFAVVLEPDEPLRTARRAFHLGMTALTDALLAFAPPEKPLVIDWPDAIRIDGGLVGGGRLAWPDGAKEDERPDWLVFGGMIRTVSMNDGEPGLHPLAAALDRYTPRARRRFTGLFEVARALDFVGCEWPNAKRWGEDLTKGKRKAR